MSLIKAGIAEKRYKVKEVIKSTTKSSGHYATNRKVTGSIHNEVIFFKIYLILPATLGPGVHSASKRNE
jgi:hypothetical protein